MVSPLPWIGPSIYGSFHLILRTGQVTARFFANFAGRNQTKKLQNPGLSVPGILEKAVVRGKEDAHAPVGQCSDPFTAITAGVLCIVYIKVPWAEGTYVLDAVWAIYLGFSAKSRGGQTPEGL